MSFFVTFFRSGKMTNLRGKQLF